MKWFPRLLHYISMDSNKSRIFQSKTGRKDALIPGVYNVFILSAEVEIHNVQTNNNVF